MIICNNKDKISLCCMCVSLHDHPLSMCCFIAVSFSLHLKINFFCLNSAYWLPSWMMILKWTSMKFKGRRYLIYWEIFIWRRKNLWFLPKENLFIFFLFFCATKKYLCHPSNPSLKNLIFCQLIIILKKQILLSFIFFPPFISVHFWKDWMKQVDDLIHACLPVWRDLFNIIHTYLCYCFLLCRLFIT